MISKVLSIPTFIQNMEDCDHLAVSYSNFEEIKEIISNFVLRGIEKKQINLWLVRQDEKELWLEVLRQKGIEVDHLIQSNELIAVDHSEIFIDSCSPSFNSILAFNSIFDKFQNLNRSSEKHKNGINAIGTFTGNLFFNGTINDCIDIETKWHQVLESYNVPVTLIHLYPSIKITEKYQSDLIEIHNRGLLILDENSKILKQKVENSPISQIEQYGDFESENFPKRELAVLETLKEIISIVQEKEILQDMGTVASKKMPKWYISLIESLIQLYDAGHDNSYKEVEGL